MHHPRANQLGGFVRQPDFVEHRYAMFANVGWRQRSRRRARTEMQKGTRNLQTTEPSVLIGLNTSEARSEEHTSELQSLIRISYAVFCLKRKKIILLT